MSLKDDSWPLFDYIVAVAAPDGAHTDPWKRAEDGSVCFVPDYKVLERLLGVPLYLGATTQSGVPALALDVWLSYELRRAGFASDQIWPRPTHPRILPLAVVKLIESLPNAERSKVTDRLQKKGAIKGVTASSASILGKNYLKQVDVIMTDWPTGPELLISTKRMDSSFGKNAPNRIEESYGDAKNLRLRHPIAALGFLFGVRSTVFRDEPDTAEWMFDQLRKLGEEDDAYHSTCAIVIEYGQDVEVEDDGSEVEDGIVDPGPLDDEDEGEIVAVEEGSILSKIDSLPIVKVDLDRIPAYLDPADFLRKMVTHVLNSTPVNMHKNARRMYRKAHDAAP